MQNYDVPQFQCLHNNVISIGIFVTERVSVIALRIYNHIGRALTY